MSGSHTAGGERAAWLLRPITLFATAYIVITTTHESAHALTAFVLDVPFTLYHFGVDVARDRATLMEQAEIGVAGPLCALIIGLISWLSYKRAGGSRSELMLLYLATFGTCTFFGNLMSAAFVGDFSRAALALQLPLSVRYAASLVGFLSVCGVQFIAGRELRKLSPVGTSKLRATITMVGLPVVTGTIIVTLVSLPMPSALLVGRLAETSFWVFGAAGVLISKKTPSGDGRTLHLGWVDMAVLMAAVIAVRIMAGGIAFE